MTNEEITKKWISQLRAVCEAANASLYSEEAEAAKSEIVCTAFDAALDALEAAYAEIASLQAERDAAIRDLKWLSNEYKFCTTCKLDNGNGVWDCNDERCDAENHYDWRGLCAENAQEGGTDVEHTTD